jgi:hypothetical protein
LRQYVTRFASTEFGERGSKVMEIDIVVTTVVDDKNTNVSVDKVSVEDKSSRMRMEYDEDDVCTISSTAATTTEVSSRG